MIGAILIEFMSKLTEKGIENCFNTDQALDAFIQSTNTWRDALKYIAEHDRTMLIGAQRMYECRM